MAINVRERVVFADPKTAAGRADVAATCVRKLGLQIPALVDGIGDAVEMAYTAWPDRLYLIGRDGRVRFKSPPGPFGFKPAALEEALRADLN